jgi:multidrug efflux pump subunit AcrA (membrane-fusion protein)
MQSDKDAVSEAVAGVNANAANLERLAVLQNYERVVAPFSGVVTARNIDPGAYISSGGGASTSQAIGSSTAGSGTSGTAASGSSTTGGASGSSSSGAGLFTIADLNDLRIYISLPQADANLVKDGAKASISVASVPGRPFTGRVARSAIALDPDSRTLVAQIVMKNPRGLLRPGMFSDVRLRVPQARGILTVPDSALVTGADGTQLILVEPGNKLHFQDVVVGDDSGITLQILSGVSKTDKVVTSPANGFIEGEQVQVQEAPPSGGHSTVRGGA